MDEGVWVQKRAWRGGKRGSGGRLVHDDRSDVPVVRILRGGGLGTSKRRLRDTKRVAAAQCAIQNTRKAEADRQRRVEDAPAVQIAGFKGLLD